jgi:hypothetical protein
MAGFARSRRRVLIWAFVKLFLTVCGGQNDAPAPASLDQPLTLSMAQAANEAVNDHLH